MLSDLKYLVIGITLLTGLFTYKCVERKKLNKEVIRYNTKKLAVETENKRKDVEIYTKKKEKIYEDRNDAFGDFESGLGR